MQQNRLSKKAFFDLRFKDRFETAYARSKTLQWLGEPLPCSYRTWYRLKGPCHSKVIFGAPGLERKKISRLNFSAI